MILIPSFNFLVPHLIDKIYSFTSISVLQFQLPGIFFIPVFPPFSISKSTGVFVS